MVSYQKEENGSKKVNDDWNEKYKKMKKNELIEKLFSKKKELEKKEKELEKVKKEFNDMKENEKDYKAQLMRMQADFENYKKREEKKKKEFMEYAKQDLICQLLSVIDNLERAASYTQNKEHQPETIEEGIKGTLKEFRSILEKEGLKPVKAVGEKFDPHCHEAIMQVESEQYPEDTVMEEISKGYYLKSKIIRPSLVKVSKGEPEKKPEKEKKDSET
ncbi:MAG: nucleotide exchange factor GrpE [Atribacterota bacterium]